MGAPESDPRSQLSLPPGFRFFPTDEELLVHYLCRKVAGHLFPLQIIGDIDLYKFDPWNLPGKALFGEKEWYFFSPRDRKYPNGSRPNRVAGSGYWKATGTDKMIATEGRKVGIKKSLVFYIGKAPKGSKTNWIMHEYRLSESPRKTGGSKLDDWVLCRIYKKNTSGQDRRNVAGIQSMEYSHDSSSSSSQYDDVLDSMPQFDDRFLTKNSQHQDDQKLNLQRLNSANFNWATLAGLSPVWPELQAQRDPVHTTNAIRSDGYAPAADLVDEVHSKPVNEQVANSGIMQSGLTQGFSASVDPFCVSYPNQPPGGFRFSQ